MTIQPPIPKNKTRPDRQSFDQTARLPIVLTDRLLVLARWALILASGAMSRFDEFGGGTFDLPMMV